MGDLSSIPGLERSPGEWNGNPPQYSSVENPMDRAAWWATAHAVTKCWDMTERLLLLGSLGVLRHESPTSLHGPAINFSVPDSQHFGIVWLLRASGAWSNTTTHPSKSHSSFINHIIPKAILNCP
ncbi:unnamed protein product [Rangifer tarandus platyrhynchus]|uniref:Uncharacterized protein n=2 Tax=Rangifer tarandus platyrhynchus TaxID=3082113 RepID=A0ABN8ZQE1_RANTA|nr:unnamed protein product [Rangifer tarandus platyrhynchus]